MNATQMKSKIKDLGELLAKATTLPHDTWVAAAAMIVDLQLALDHGPKDAAQSLDNVLTQLNDDFDLVPCHGCGLDLYGRPIRLVERTRERGEESYCPDCNREHSEVKETESFLYSTER